MATSLEEFITGIKTHTSTGDYETLNDFVSKSFDWLDKNVNNLDTVFNKINPNDYSIGILAILNIKLKQMKPAELLTNKQFLEQISEFASASNKKHISNFPSSFAELYRTLSDMLIQAGQSRIGINTLYKATRKLQAAPGGLTTLHAEMCRLCLHAKNFKPAFKILNETAALSSEEYNILGSKALLLYFYYGGLLYAAVKNYPRAHHFLEIAVTTPTVVVSHIMIAAYQKYILISLIMDATGLAYNQSYALPRHTSQVVSRGLKHLCQPYIDIASVYYNGNCSKLSAIMRKHAETLNNDQNKGLANNVFLWLYKKNIKLYRKIFITVPLSELTERTCLQTDERLELCLKEMISEREINSRINKEDSVVKFLKPVSKFNHTTMLKDIEHKIHGAMTIEKKITTIDEEISLNSQFLKKMIAPSEDDITHQKLSSTFTIPMP